MKMVPLVKEKEVLFISGMKRFLFYLCINFILSTYQYTCYIFTKASNSSNISKLYPSKKYCLEINSSTSQSCKSF